MPRRWWARRSIRARVTALAVLSLAAGLVAGSVALAALFARDRLHDLDRQTRTEAGVLRGLVDSGQLPQPLPAPVGTGLLAQVLDASGTVLAASPSASRLVGLMPPEALRTGAGSTRTLRDPFAGGGPLRVTVESATLHAAPVSIVSAVPLGDVEDTLRALGRTLLLVVPVVVAAAGAAAWIAVGAALRPVERLRASADAVRPSQPGRHGPPALPEPRSRDEIARLAATLNGMLARLDAAAARQRTFVADAAHELRSPLASLTTSLEVALVHPERADWPAVAHDALADAGRLARLVDDLLLLARLDADADIQAARSTRPVDLAELSAAQGVSARSEAPAPLVSGDPRALARLLRNLLDNARRSAYSTVEVRIRRDDRVVELRVVDDGPGVPASDRERVFERFVRLDDARSRDTGGAGLGLPIARTIARRHGGELTLEESPLGGTAAVLRLPAPASTPLDHPRPETPAADTPAADQGDVAPNVDSPTTTP